MKIYKYNESEEILKKILDRDIKVDKDILNSVQEIVGNVRNSGDKALFEYAKKFDNFELNSGNIVVEKEYLDSCISKCDNELLELIKEAANNIRIYHQNQKQESWIKEFDDEVKLGQKITPLNRVGVYVPGGQAFYPSTCLMNIIPAQVAQVKEIVVATPPKSFYENPLIGAVLSILGIEKVYLSGGAQGVAAMAFGTESFPKVDKIVGPGNIFVAMAKREVFGFVDIDMIAGPSEIVVVADKSSNPKWVALDILSQSEHRTGFESSILITDDIDVAKSVQKYVIDYLKDVDYGKKVGEILNNYGAIVVTNSIDESIDVVNRIAPEHLELAVDSAEELLEKVENAGAIFLGHYSSEPVGDYWAGPNHVLPTNGTARFFSPLGVYDFVKKSSIINYSKKAILKHGEKINKFALSEDLYFHGKAVYQRFEDLSK